MKALSVIKKKQISLPLVEEAVKMVLLFLVSRATILGVHPFGIGLWAAVMSRRSTYYGIIPILLGVLSARGEVLKYMLAIGLYLIYTQFRKNKAGDMFFCGISVAVSGVITILFNSQSVIYMLVPILEGLLTCFGYVVVTRSERFYKSYRGFLRASQEEIISVVLLCGILLTGFSGLYITNKLQVGMALGLYLILCISRCTTVAVAGSVGLCLGFVCSLNSPYAIVVMGISGIGGILANILKDFGKLGCVAGFMLGGGLCFLYVGDAGSMPISIYEEIVASILFLATPKTVFLKFESVMAKTMKAPDRGKEGRIKEYIASELKILAKAFSSLSEGCISLSKKEENIAQATDMFDMVAERVCKKCSDWGMCWIDGFNDMYRNMFDILNVIETEGNCDMRNLPPLFKGRCRNSEKFLSEFNHLYEIYKQNAIWQGEANEGQNMMAKQYHEISNLIKDMSEELETGLSFMESAEAKIDNALEKAGLYAKEVNVIENSRHEPEVYISSGFAAEPEFLEEVVSEALGMSMKIEEHSSSTKLVAHNRFSVEYAVCQHSGAGEQMCGDTVMQFDTEDNKFCVLLCDGMGEGDEASKESRLTASLFQDFLRAGFIKDTAVKIVNSTLAMKAGRENFSTVDLTEIDLRTGNAEFLKVGAAESFVKRGDNVEIISALSMPVGILEDVNAPVIKKGLCEGDVIVMISDGISDTDLGEMKGNGIARVMREYNENMQELADAVLKGAREKAYPKPCDDMTVVALKLKKAV